MTRRCGLFLLLPLLFLTSACGSGSTDGDTADKELKVAFVTNNSADFWTIARAGVEKADSELADVSAEFRMTSDGTSAEQRRILDDLLIKGVGAVAISPVDPENQTSFLNDAAKKAL